MCSEGVAIVFCYGFNISILRNFHLLLTLIFYTRKTSLAILNYGIAIILRCYNTYDLRQLLKTSHLVLQITMLCTRLKHKHKAKVSLQHGTPKQGRLMMSRSRPAAAMSSPFKRLRLSPVAERLQERDYRDVATDGWNERQRMWRTNATKQRENKENFVGGSQVSSGKESGFHDVPSGSEQARRTSYKARGKLYLMFQSFLESVL